MLYSMALEDCFSLNFGAPLLLDVMIYVGDGRITDNIHKSNSIKFSNIY